MIYDVAIVGGGIAGYTAALTSKNLKLNYVWLAKKPFGEKLPLAEEVRNFPSFEGSGKQLSAELLSQMVQENVFLTRARIDGIYKMGSENFTLTAGDEGYEAHAVILCTGVDLTRRTEGERKFLGKGVSYCAVCDGALYTGKKIAAFVTSESFEEDVRLLSSFAREVHAFYEKGVKQVELPKLINHSCPILAVEGGTRVERVVSEEGTLDVDGVFFFREAAPPEALCRGLKCEGAHIVVQKDMSTNLEGVFAAGDVTGAPYQLVKAAGEGLVAAFSARDFLKRSKST